MSTNSIYLGRYSTDFGRFSNFLNKSYIKHGSKYDYSKVEYSSNSKEVEIICEKHGSFFKTPQSHTNNRNGGGCQECNFENRRKTLDLFIEQSNIIHNNKYNYNEVLIKNNKNDVIIICEEHGKFRSSPSNHLKGSGCPDCGNKRKNFSHCTYNKILLNDICHLYTLEFENNNEKFYKVGITNNLKKRIKELNNKSKYNVSLVRSIIDIRHNCYNIEQKLLSKYKLNKRLYNPIYKFSGYTECFI